MVTEFLPERRQLELEAGARREPAEQNEGQRFEAKEFESQEARYVPAIRSTVLERPVIDHRDSAVGEFEIPQPSPESICGGYHKMLGTGNTHYQAEIHSTRGIRIMHLEDTL